MAKDLIQIVDENDNVIGTADRLEAHRSGKIHRISRVTLENDRGQVLVQLRSNNVDDFPGYLDHAAGGHVDVGEDYLTAAKRELFEELGVKDVELTEVGHYYSEEVYKDKHLNRFNKLYKAKVNFTPKNLQADEVDEVKWFTIKELKKLAADKNSTATSGLLEVINRFY